MDRTTRWIWVATATSLIYLSLPYGPRLWLAFRDLVSPWHRDAALVVLLLAAAIAGLHERQRLRRLPLWGWTLLGAVAAAYLWFMLGSSLAPGEKTHFLSYGILAWLVFRALPPAGPARRYWGAGLLAGIIGLGDELIQDALPQRVFEWKDVAVNAASATLALLVISAMSTSRADRE